MGWRRWTEKEINLFYQGKSDTEIIMETGRTYRAVEQKRRKIVNGTCEDPVPDYTVIINPYMNLTQADKIRRITDLAKRLQVKLGG